jgi:ATP-binding protein involved in chromosome partitioning
VVRVGGDDGRPVVISAPESPAAIALSEIASKVAAAISVQNVSHPLTVEFGSDPDLPVMNR